jgi:hypothetical protein
MRDQRRWLLPADEFPPARYCPALVAVEEEK